MMTYRELLGRLGYGHALQRCADGTTPVPLVAYGAPAAWYTHPPALIPVIGEGSGPTYYGVWKHWFTDRPASFVKMYVEAGHEVVEIARSEQQFFSYLVLQALCEGDGRSQYIEDFAVAVGIADVDAIDGVALESGDKAEGLRHLPAYSTNLPAVCAADNPRYDGWFPIGGINRETASSFEFPRETLEVVRAAPTGPIWLRTQNQPAAFARLMADGDLGGAWLSLNSTGWTLGEAENAAKVMAARASEGTFRQMVDIWSARLTSPGHTY